jgi:hypothetical protein
MNSTVCKIRTVINISVIVVSHLFTNCIGNDYESNKQTNIFIDYTYLLYCYYNSILVEYANKNNRSWSDISTIHPHIESPWLKYR